LYRGAAVLDEGGVADLPGLGRGRDRHDEHARGEACPRGGALLRDARARDRLRRLARDARAGVGRGGRPEPPEERRDRQGRAARGDPGHRPGAHVRVPEPPAECGHHASEGVPAADAAAPGALARQVLSGRAAPARACPKESSWVTSWWWVRWRSTAWKRRSEEHTSE